MPSAAADRSPDVLEREIERSRRYRHAFTLIRVSPAPFPAHRMRMRPQRVGRSRHRRTDPLEELAAELRSCLRSGDVAWSDGTAVFVLLPETDAAGADAMLARLRRVALAWSGEPDLRVASFPEDGVTHHALRAAVAHRKEPEAPRNGSGAGGRARLATDAIDR